MVRIIFLRRSWFEVFKETPAKELIQANCYLRHCCSELLVIDVIFIWFSGEMPFTLTTLNKIGEWNLLQQIMKQERFFVQE